MMENPKTKGSRLCIPNDLSASALQPTSHSGRLTNSHITPMQGIREDLFKPLDVALLSSETFDLCPFAFPATESDPDTSISLALYDYESLWWLAVWFLAAHVPVPLSTPAWSASVVPRIAISSDRAEEFHERAYRQLFPTPGPSSASLAHVSRSIPLPAQRKEMLRSPRSPPPGRATTPPAGYTRMFAWQHAGYLQSVLYGLSATKYFPNAANALVDAHVALRDIKSRDAAHPGNKWISREAAAALESAFTIVGERAAWLSDGKVMVARPGSGW